MCVNTKSIHQIHRKWIFITLLENCTNTQELKPIHGQMITNGLIQDMFFASRIVALSSVCSSTFGMLDYARRVFDRIQNPNSFIWNSMIKGYLHNRAPKEAIFLFKQMHLRGSFPDNYTYPILIKACANLCALNPGRTLQGMVVKSGFESDAFVTSGIVNLYARCGEIEVARQMFDKISQRDIVLWTTMIVSYAQLNRSEEALKLFDEMKRKGVRPNKVTIVSLFSVCAQLQALDRGLWLHSYIVENKIECDVLVGNSLVNMYAKCGNFSKAIQVFGEMPVKNTVSWNVLIGGLAQSYRCVEALEIFRDMQISDVKPNEITMVNTLSACAQLGNLGQGKFVHAYIKEHSICYDIFVRNALINMYTKCGDLEGAHSVFKEMSERDVFSWTTMITGYVQGNYFKEALALFQEMQLSSIEPNEVTLVSLLSACAQLGALDQGKWIHAYIEEKNVNSDVFVGNALIDMYSKCGCIEIASRIFSKMPQRDIFSWNAIIGGLAVNGKGREAINLFCQMQRTDEIKPDHVTLTGILCACSHARMVDEGYHYFNGLTSLYDITPTIEHYGCMVDLLSRAGLLEEAWDLIKKMPMEPNAVIWGSLLAGCRVYRNAELGERVAWHILESTPDDEGAYVLLSNIYAESGKWDDVRRVRNLMSARGVEKFPGCSLIEVNGVVNEFFARDRLHHRYNQIYLILDSLNLQLMQLNNEINSC